MVDDWSESAHAPPLVLSPYTPVFLKISMDDGLTFLKLLFFQYIYVLN